MRASIFVPNLLNRTILHWVGPQDIVCDFRARVIQTPLPVGAALPIPATRLRTLTVLPFSPPFYQMPSRRDSRELSDGDVLRTWGCVERLAVQGAGDEHRPVRIRVLLLPGLLRL